MGAALLSPVASVSAFDLPPFSFGEVGLTAVMIPYTLEDPEANRKFASKANPDKPRQQVAAQYAISKFDIDSLQGMADGGWTLADVADDNGKTLLHIAAQIGNDPAVKLLIKVGSPVDAYTSFKETPLHLAVRNKNLACVKLLVEGGADISVPYSKSGDTALTLAKKYKFVDIFEYLNSKEEREEEGRKRRDA